MREVVLDTETTGLEPADGHRVVEIGAVELFNHLPTGRVFHEYINPERDMPAEAERIHGLSETFLANKPVFAAIATSFLDFLEQDESAGAMPATLVIHNAAFDMKFLNSEFERMNLPPIPYPSTRVIDTLQRARQRFPGSPASLDALCRRFDVDSSARTQHGALLDSELLADVYLGLIGGRQPGFDLAVQSVKTVVKSSAPRIDRAPRPHQPSPAEQEAHRAFLTKIKGAIWQQP